MKRPQTRLYGFKGWEKEKVVAACRRAVESRRITCFTCGKLITDPNWIVVCPRPEQGDYFIAFFCSKECGGSWFNP